MNWQLVPHGYICERIIGFSLPIDGEVAVISYEGIHILALDSPASVTHHPEHPEGGSSYDRKRQRLAFGRRHYSILGLHGGEPLLTSNRGETVALAEGDRLVVRDASDREVFSHRYTDLSGDWAFATFTPDFRYILLGLPYDLLTFKRTG